jgi:predicted Rossmann-fold nucleotide-binding protein
MITSDAFVVVPGGIGTLLELSMAWQLLQVSELRRTPLILVGAMWVELVDWARKSMLRPDLPLASPADMEIPHCVETIEETVAIIRRDREEWLAQQAAAAREK